MKINYLDGVKEKSLYLKDLKPGDLFLFKSTGTEYPYGVRLLLTTGPIPTYFIMEQNVIGEGKRGGEVILVKGTLSITK